MTNTVLSGPHAGFHVLPVTALCVLDVNDATFLLVGAGGHLRIREFPRSDQVSTCQVFVAQAIHGIRAYDNSFAHLPCRTVILVWGGKSLSLCTVQPDDGCDLLLKVNVKKIWSQVHDDWIQDVSFVEDGTKAVILTAHNAVYEVQLSEDSPPTPSLLCDELQTLLYSGCIATCDQNTLLIASGTVFGEIVVWKCSRKESDVQSKAQLQHLYLGHRGSIFGVSISDPIEWEGTHRRLLASCSDDRTIRIWDISEGKQGDSLTTSEQTQHNTGFGGVSGESASLAMAWGHLSRIWHVQFANRGIAVEGDHLELTSRGEDGVCQYWTVSKNNLFSQRREQLVTLQPVSHDRHHAGKNIWSWTQSVSGGQYRVFTGGADGQIIARPFETPTRESSKRLLAIKFQRLFSSMESTSHSTSNEKRPLGKALKQYLILRDGVIIATTDMGVLLRGSLKDVSVWTMIAGHMDEAVKILCSNQIGQLVFFGTSSSRIAAYDATLSKVLYIDFELPAQISWMQLSTTANIGSSHHDVMRLIVSFYGYHPPGLLNVRYENETLKATVQYLQMPPEFLITSFHFDEHHDTLVFGSRAGALAIFHNYATSQTDSDRVICVRHAHGSDSVTSIMVLPRTTGLLPSLTWYLTTGRDGTYAVHLVSWTGPEVSPQIRTVHRSRPQLGPNIEGAYLGRSGNDEQTIVLYGFRSTEFVVWDESHQIQLLAVECGGAHRSWYFRTSDGSDKLASFIWNQAATFNAYQNAGRSCNIIQPGGHGREIKALAVSSSNIGQHGQVGATGAEDTDIRLFRYNESSGKFCFVRVLQSHTTGLQHLEFSRCGKYLFSSAGCEEMYVWHLHEVPVLGLGAVLMAKLPKEAEDSDARIMSFDIIDVLDENEGEGVFRICLAYSNGKVKSFSYVASSSSFKFSKELFVSMICLTQAHLLSETCAVVGATDGVVRLVDFANMVSVVSSRIHQNNIAGMVVTQLDKIHALVITGGDDSAVGFSVIRFDDQPQIQTSLAVDAHAAASTSVVLLDLLKHGSDCTALIASVGNDQKVKIWEVHIDLQPHALNDTNQNENRRSQLCSIGVKRIKELWTDVADASSMEVMNGGLRMQSDKQGEKIYHVLVAGVGMQILPVSIGSSGRQR